MKGIRLSQLDAYFPLMSLIFGWFIFEVKPNYVHTCKDVCLNTLTCTYFGVYVFRNWWCIAGYLCVWILISYSSEFSFGQCLKFMTDQAQDANNMEKLNNIFLLWWPGDQTVSSFSKPFHGNRIMYCWFQGQKSDSKLDYY